MHVHIHDIVGAYTINCAPVHAVLYTIVLHTNEEEHTVPLEALENTITGLPLQKEEAVINQEVVWLHKGKIPYKATIVGSQSSNMGKCSRQGQGAKNGGVSTAKRADLDVDEEVTDDDIAKGNSIPPSDVSDEEQGKHIILCRVHAINRNVRIYIILFTLTVYRADY